MRLRIFQPIESIGNIKATVQRSGKLGFSMGAIKVLELDKEECRFFQIASNEDDEEDKSLYLIRTERDDKNAFQAKKAGTYYYLRIKHVLNKMDIDYQNESVIYDIIEKENDNQKYFQLRRREPVKRK